ncbi:MAG: hemerythrin domain-containing protein [Candidatus Sericytochromatia bacterium]
MKRDPALAELSREHLPALMLAYCLRHGRSSNPQYPWPEQPEQQRERVLAFVRPELARHFEAEECFLLPLKDRLADPGPSERVRAEHVRFWQLLAQIEAAHAAGLPLLLMALGELLEAHIRFEERVWFEQLQQELPPELLAELGQQLEAFLGPES